MKRLLVLARLAEALATCAAPRDAGCRTLALSAAMGAHARTGGVADASRRKDPPQLTFG